MITAGVLIAESVANVLWFATAERDAVIVRSYVPTVRKSAPHAPSLKYAVRVTPVRSASAAKVIFVITVRPVYTVQNSYAPAAADAPDALSFVRSATKNALIARIRKFVYHVTNVRTVQAENRASAITARRV